MNFEKPNNSLNVPDQSNEHAVEQERVNKLWKDYRLNGKPVRVGTPVYERLFETCRKYIDIIYNDKANMMAGSDSIRRNLHNTIALMVDGNDRSRMTEKRAGEIANFASMLVFKLPISEMDSIYTQSRRDQE